jgi:hypothetical protein
MESKENKADRRSHWKEWVGLVAGVVVAAVAVLAYFWPQSGEGGAGTTPSSTQSSAPPATKTPSTSPDTTVPESTGNLIYKGKTVRLAPGYCTHHTYVDLDLPKVAIDQDLDSWDLDYSDWRCGSDPAQLNLANPDIAASIASPHTADLRYEECLGLLDTQPTGDIEANSIKVNARYCFETDQGNIVAARVLKGERGKSISLTLTAWTKN